MIRIFLGALLILMPNSVLAQKTSGSVICIGGQRWTPTLQEARVIKIEPVPPSLRAIFEPRDPCAYWNEYAPKLVYWHIRFGDAQTMKAALVYIEQRLMRKNTDPSQYVNKLQQQFISAKPDMVRALEVKQPEGVNYNAQFRFLHSRKKVQRFKALLRDREDFQFLAGLYLRAAEEYSDTDLLAKADHYLDAAVEGAEFLASIEDTAPVKGQFHFNLKFFQLDDWLARAALLRSAISRTPKTLEAAHSALQSEQGEIHGRLAKAAFSGGNSFCDISKKWGDAELVKQCHSEDDIQERVTDRIINLAVFHLLWINVAERQKQRELDAYFDHAIKLLSFERIPDYQTRCCGRYPDQDLFRLYNAKADSIARRIQSAKTKSQLSDLRSRWYQGLDSLQQAQQLYPFYQAPARSKRIAEKWLQLEETGSRLFARSDGRSLLNTDMVRFKKYLQNMISDDQ